MSERPKCVGCATPLKKYTRRIYENQREYHGGEVIFSNEDGKPLIVDGKRVLQITRTVRSNTPSYNNWSVWLGEYGYDAYGLFCSKTCASYWARDIMLGIRSGQVKLERIMAKARRAQSTEVNL